MVFQDSTNLNNMSKYIVDVNGDTPYVNIQSALDAANTAGVAAVVEVRPGTYTEDLTLYTGITIDGGSLGTTIIGNHTPPLIGTFTFRNVNLVATTGDIISSAAAGSAILLITNCITTVVNGYIYDVPNWTGPLAITSCTDASTNNGIINNTAAALVILTTSNIGAGVGNTLTKTDGTLDIISCQIGCPINIGGTCTAIVNEGSSILGNLTTAGTATISMVHTRIVTGAVQAITHGSANELSLSEVTIDTSNVTAIGGAGAGNLQIGSIVFLDSSVIAGTLTVDRTPTLTTGVARTTTIEAIGAGAGAQNVIDITPAIAIGGVAWSGVLVDGAALDPTGANSVVYAFEADLSGVAVTNDPDLIGAHITMPAAISGEGCDSGIRVEGYGITSLINCNQREAGFFTDGTIEQEFDITAFTAVDTGLAHSVNIDNTGSTGGDFHALDVTVTGAGTSEVYAVGTNPEVGVIHQHTGAFGATAQSWKFNGGFTDVTAAFDNPAVDVTIFDADNDYIYIGSNAVFSEIRVILNTASGRNIFPIFEYSTVGPVWVPFTPADGTNGFTQNGIIEFDSADLAAWAAVVVNGANHFYVRIQRTRNNIVTTPIEDTIRILEPVEYYWDEGGDVVTASLTTVGCNATTFDTNVAAAGVTLGGTTLAADGTDANIDISITPKGTGVLLTSDIGNAADTSAIVITAAGEVTKPLTSAFLALNSVTDANQTGNGGLPTVDFDTEVFDQNADFAADTFTAPVTGRYNLNSYVLINNITAAMTQGFIYIVTSNRTYSTGTINAGAAKDSANNIALDANVLADMDAADTAYIQVQLLNGAGDTAGITGNAAPLTWFSGSLIC